MKVHLAGVTQVGRAIDLRDAGFRPSTVVAAIRGEAEDCTITVDCPDPGPTHDHVGTIRGDSTVSLRPALAAAARSRGHVAPQAEELAAVRERLDALDAPEVDLRQVRKRVAEASDAEAELRERVATLRGRVQALRETADPESAETRLADATRRLSEVETERIAAEQALARARQQARDARETRRERLRLQDRLGNLRRAARGHLADCVSDAFDDARDSLPGDVELSEDVSDALAVARIADLDAPVVLACDADLFECVEDAARWLGGPVVLL